MVIKDAFIPVDFVVSLEGENFEDSFFNMENTFLSSDGRIVRVPNTLDEPFIPEEYFLRATKNTKCPGMIEFFATEMFDVFSCFTENITDIDYLLDAVRFMFFVLTVSIVSIHIVVIIFTKV